MVVHRPSSVCVSVAASVRSRLCETHLSHASDVSLRAQWCVSSFVAVRGLWLFENMECRVLFDGSGRTHPRERKVLRTPLPISRHMDVACSGAGWGCTCTSRTGATAELRLGRSLLPNVLVPDPRLCVHGVEGGGRRQNKLSSRDVVPTHRHPRWATAENCRDLCEPAG